MMDNRGRRAFAPTTTDSGRVDPLVAKPKVSREREDDMEIEPSAKRIRIEHETAEFAAAKILQSLRNSSFTTPREVKPASTNAIATVERAARPTSAWDNFATHQRKNVVEQIRLEEAKNNTDIKLEFLRKFSDGFKLHTPVPRGLVSIMARDPMKQGKLQEKAMRNAEEAKTNNAPEVPKLAQRSMPPIFLFSLPKVPSRQDASMGATRRSGMDILSSPNLAEEISRSLNKTSQQAAPTDIASMVSQDDIIRRLRMQETHNLHAIDRQAMVATQHAAFQRAQHAASQRVPQPSQQSFQQPSSPTLQWTYVQPSQIATQNPSVVEILIPSECTSQTASSENGNDIEDGDMTDDEDTANEEDYSKDDDYSEYEDEPTSSDLTSQNGSS